MYLLNIWQAVAKPLWDSKNCGYPLSWTHLVFPVAVLEVAQYKVTDTAEDKE